MSAYVEKPTIITVQAGPGRHIAAVTLFQHLAAALEQHCFDGITTLIVHGDGAVSIDRNGRRETAYTPRRMKQREEAR